MARPAATQPRYATEADLCADFITEVRREGKWECYPETESWDILLVRKTDGFQIGVSAKLRFNARVIGQALETHTWTVDGPGPDCRAVLVPSSDGDLATVCAYIGLTVITLRPKPGLCVRYHRIEPALPNDDRDYRPGLWSEWAPSRRHQVPEYVPDCVAGASAPIRLTAWKVAAIKLAVLLETRPITRADFKHVGIDHRRWLPNEAGWLRLTPSGYVPGPGIPDFRTQHPRNYEQIKADLPKWAPPQSSMPAAPRVLQEALL